MINKVWVQKAPSTIIVGIFLLQNPRVNIPVEDWCFRSPSERPRVIFEHITQGCELFPTSHAALGCIATDVQLNHCHINDCIRKVKKPLWNISERVSKFGRREKKLRQRCKTNCSSKVQRLEEMLSLNKIALRKTCLASELLMPSL